jgi:uncharacterized protein YbjT (DUF2867 family)
MHIAIIGATGFIGKALIKRLLKDGGHRVTAFSKSAHKLTAAHPDAIDFTALSGSIFDAHKLQQALQGCDVAIYLVHMMGASHDDYAKLEADGARAFAQAANQAGVKRVVFLGGLGDSASDLSKHLRSRQRTGKILRSKLPLVIELRASMIIGEGSVAYEIIRAIANKLPITAVPRWANTRTQPIRLTDMLDYLVAATSVQIGEHQIVEVGGPEVLTYPQILERYTAWKGHRYHAFIVPGVPRWAATLWLNRYTSSKASGIGKPMVDSLHHEMVVTNDTAQRLFPTILPEPIETGF